MQYNVPKEFTFLGQVPEFKKGLPTGCLINKGKVGCGGTSIALEDDRNTIVCVPFVNLIKNKMSKYNNEEQVILGVFEGVSREEIAEYMRKDGTKKIMCTYESLEKVVGVVGFDWFLLVDEYHLLFQQYTLRNDAVKYILNNYARFTSWAFMTATPVDDLILEELKDVPVYNIEWEAKNIAKVQTIHCNNVLVSTRNIINEFLDGKVFGNCHIFINSVNSIATLIKNCGLTNENTRIIFSKTNSNYRHTCQGVTNRETTDPVKKINMYTSTCFEGCDLWDEQGKIYIVSDGAKAQTLYDVSTQIQQIAGRIRNTHYTDIIHLYSSTRYAGDLTFDEYKKICEKEERDCKVWAERVNADDIILEGALTSKYEYLVKDNTFKYDPNRFKLDIYNFKCLHSVYCISYNLIDEYTKAGFTASYMENTTSDKLLAKSDTRTTFKDAVEEYDKIMTRRKECQFYIEDTERTRLLTNKYPFMEKAYELLGMDKMREMKFHVSNIKEAVICRSDTLNNTAKIAKLLKGTKGFQLGAFITGKDIKRVLGEIYKMIGYNRTPKLDDFRQFATIKEKCIRVDGKFVNGYQIQFIKIA